MIHLVSDKSRIIFDRSGFERLSYPDIERTQQILDVVFPDVLLSECLNPSKPSRKKLLNKKLLKFSYIWIFTRADCESIISHEGIRRDIQLNQFQDTVLLCVRTQEVLESLDFKWLRNFMDDKNRDINQRGYNYYLDGLDEGKSFNDLINSLAENNSMSDDEKRELKNYSKNIGAPGSSQEPEDIAGSVDNLILMNYFGHKVETLEDIKAMTETDIDYNAFNDESKYLIFHEWMTYYLIMGESAGMKGLDKSYFNDLMYCYYVPLCDIFVTAEKTFPLVLKPIVDRFDFFSFMTFEEFSDRYLK